MTNGERDITRQALVREEARFLTRVGSLPAFSLADARRVLGRRQGAHVRQFMARL